VARKIEQSRLADKSGEVVVLNWMTDVYDRLPEGENLHYFVKHRQVWSRVEKLAWSDIIEPMRRAKLLSLWFPIECVGEQLLEGEMNAIQRLSAGREMAVDLGTFKGLSATLLAATCRRVHTIDCYRDLPADYHADILQPRRWDIWTHTLEENQAMFDRWGNITCEAGLTAEAAKSWRGPPVDFMFVDADHSEQGTLKNVYGWKKRMRPGGRILLHDNTDINPGVMAAIRKLQADQSLREIDVGPDSGSLWGCEVVS
jgi:hypothetical protein